MYDVLATPRLELCRVSRFDLQGTAFELQNHFETRPYEHYRVTDTRYIVEPHLNPPGKYPPPPN